MATRQRQSSAKLAWCRWPDARRAAHEQQWHGHCDHGLQNQLQDHWGRGRLLLLPGAHSQCSAGAADLHCGAPHDGALLVSGAHEQQVGFCHPILLSPTESQGLLVARHAQIPALMSVAYLLLPVLSCPTKHKTHSCITLDIEDLS